MAVTPQLQLPTSQPMSLAQAFAMPAPQMLTPLPQPVHMSPQLQMLAQLGQQTMPQTSFGQGAVFPAPPHQQLPWLPPTHVQHTPPHFGAFSQGYGHVAAPMLMAPGYPEVPLAPPAQTGGSWLQALRGMFPQAQGGETFHTPLAQPPAAESTAAALEAAARAATAAMRSPGTEVHVPDSGANEHDPDLETHVDPGHTPADGLQEPSIPLSEVMKLIAQLAKPQSAPSSSPPAQSFAREADRVIIPSWPTAAGMVEQWLFALEANIVSASAVPDAAAKFCAEMRNIAFPDQMLITMRDPRLAGLDSKIYAALIHVLMAKDSEDSRRILLSIRQNVAAGSGRQAVRAIMADFASTGTRQQQLALTALHNVRPCSEFAMAEKTITEISEHLVSLNGSRDMPSENMLMVILRNTFMNTPRLKEVFAAFDLQPGASPALLLLQLKRVCAEARATARPKAKANTAKETDTKGTAAAGKGGDGKGKDPKAKPKAKAKVKDGCTHCGKAGHTAADCWSKTKHCDFCGKGGHTKDVCFKNPQSSKYKAASASAASSSGAQVALNAEALATLQSFTQALAQSSTPSVYSMPSSAGALVRPSAPPGFEPTAHASAAASTALPESAQHAAFQRAQALLKQQFGLEACARQPRDDDDLLLDSGATFHFSGRRRSVRPIDEPINIWTATGPVQFTESTQMCNAQLPEPLEACFSEGAPDAAGMGKLIKQYKLHFSWSYDDYDRPLLIDSGGNKFRVRVEADCPILSQLQAPMAVAALDHHPPAESSCSGESLSISSVGPHNLSLTTSGTERASAWSIGHPVGAIARCGLGASCVDAEFGGDQFGFDQSGVGVFCAAESASSANLDEDVSLPGVDVVPDGTDTFMMDEPEPATRILGIQIEDMGSDGSVSTKVIKQTEYCQHVVETFKQREQTRTSLRAFNTPAAESELDSLGTQDNSSRPGRHAAAAAMFIGMLLYLMRGTRPDLAVTTSVLGSYVTKWGEPCDKALSRCIGYLEAHADHGLVFVGDSRDLEFLYLDTLVDSDHAAHKADSISVNGAVSMLIGHHLTRAAIGWFATRMTIAATSSGEAETVATGLCLKRLALPLSGLIETLMTQATVVMRVRGDATVAERCVLSGRSKTLRYIRKVHRVSLHFCKQIFDIDGHEYEHVPSGENTSDVLTKPLPAEVHWKHCSTMGFHDVSKFNSTSQYLSSIGVVFTCGSASSARLTSIPEEVSATTDVKYVPTADSRRVWTHPEPPSSFVHHLLHLPGHHDCTTCQLAKIAVKPARRLKEPDYVTQFGKRWYLDLIGPMPPDIFMNKFLSVGRDEGTSFAIVQPLLDKSSGTVAEKFTDVLDLPTEITRVRPDWGKEFEGRFEALCRRRNVTCERGLPRRSTNYARAERWHRTLEEGTRCYLLQSNFSHRWYSLAACMFAEHWNRISHRQRRSPWLLRYGSESTMELRPFGSLVYYLKDPPNSKVGLPKFEPRGDVGVIVGYFLQSGFWILRLAPFVQHGTISFKRTRDVKFPPGPPRYPLTDLMARIVPAIVWHFSLPCEKTPESEEAPSETLMRCATCAGFLDDGPITCEACLDGRPSSRLRSKTSNVKVHSDSHICKLRRCQCTREEEHEASAVVFEPVTVAAPVAESRGICDVAFGEFQMAEDLEGPPETVASDFCEPDILEPVVQAAAASAVSGVLEQCALDTSPALRAQRSFMCVYQSVKLDSDVAKSQAGIDAIQCEMNNMFTSNAFDPFDTVEEWSDIKRRDPTALVVWAHLLIGIKSIEAVSSQKVKARLVAGGNCLMNAFGKLAAEEALYGAPASLETIRVVVWWSCMRPDFLLLQSDVRHAYLQAWLRGPPVYVVLPRRVWPDSWSNMRAPAVRLRKAIYGLKRSGFDWMDHATQVLQRRGWRRLVDLADSLFAKGDGAETMLLALYVDDILAAGPGSLLRAELCALGGGQA